MQKLRLLALCAALAIVAGCSRSYPAPAGHRELGQGCANAGECASGACADGVCCDRTCQGSEACDVPGSVGICQPRPLGAACGDAGMCPTGFCVDGVCCDAACGDNCESCANDGGQGHCAFAPDNTDPRRDCGNCAACFAGDCGPAYANTDPHGECGPGMTCSGNYFGSSTDGGSCGVADGFPCATDSDCAGYSGYCVAWRCLEVTYFHVDDYPLLKVDRHRTPIAMAVGPAGDTAILVDSDDGVNPDDGGLVGSLVAAVASSTLGPWTAASVEYAAYGRRQGAAAFTGDIAVFAVDSQVPPGSDLAESYGYSGIYTQAINSRGVLQGFDDPDPGADDVRQIALDADARGRLTLASATGDGALRVAVRGIDGHWGPVAIFADANATGVAAARAGGETQLFALSGRTLVRVWSDGGMERAVDAPPDCDGPLYASPAADDGGDMVGLTFTCGGAPYLAVLAPARPDAPYWRVLPAPLSSPYYGLEDDGTVYPLSQFLPSGGRAGSVIFTALEPGDAPGAPQGGYTQTLWLSLDGGLAFSYSAASDNGYRYVSMAAAQTASGAPISAFDTVVDVDGGAVTGNSTLLIQTYFP